MCLNNHALFSANCQRAKLLVLVMASNLARGFSRGQRSIRVSVDICIREAPADIARNRMAPD